jgi:hypothetical protein
MQKIDVQMLLDEVFLSLATQNFYPFPAQHQLRRNKTFGFESVVVSVSSYEDVSLVEFFLGIRHELVEKTAFQFTNGHKAFAPNSHTLLVSMALLLGKKIQRYSLKTQDEIEGVVSDFLENLKEVGYDFWQANQSLEQLHNLFNSNPSEPLRAVSNELIRAVKGTVISKLIQNPNHEELEELYFHKLSNNGTPKEMLDNYLRLIGLLRLHSYN